MRKWILDIERIRIYRNNPGLKRKKETGEMLVIEDIM